MIIYLRTPSEHPLRCHETKPFIVIDTDGSFLVRRLLFFFRLLVRLAADFAHSDTPPGLVLKKKTHFGKRGWKKKL